MHTVVINICDIIYIYIYNVIGGNRESVLAVGDSGP